MTDDERRMEDMMLGKHLGKDKGTIKFMQKYYHKGAFYMVSRYPQTQNYLRGGRTLALCFGSSWELLSEVAALSIRPHPQHFQVFLTRL